jgi:hypothetical protein
MKSGAFRRALGLTLLYIGLFVLAVVVQFSKGPGLSEKFGSLTVSASYPKAAAHANAGTTPESLRLSYSGISFLISPKSVAETVGADGVATPLSLTSIEKLPNGILINFSSGVTLKAAIDIGPPEHFGLAATAPDGVTAVRLRLSPYRSARFSEKDGKRSLDSAGASYEISLGAGSLDAGGGFVSLRPGDSGFVLAKIPPAAPARPKTASPEKLVAQAPKDPEAFKAEIAAWRDKVWSGFSTTRFDADKLTWKGADGLPAFSDKTLTAYLAESLARGVFADSLARVRGAKEKWADQLSYLSAPYIGGLVPKMKALEAGDLAETKHLTQLLADKSPSILEEDGFLRFLLDRAPPSLARDAFRYLSGIDPAKLSIRQSIGYLGGALDAKAVFNLKDEEDPFRNPAVTADLIVAAARRTSSALYLVTEDDGSSDVRTSLAGGCFLAAYGAASAKPEYVGIGQGLVEGVLGLSDSQGFVPARVSVRADAIEQRTGAIAPEELYPLVADNSYYPREVSFYRDIAPGFWAWTCAPSLVVKASASRYVFTAVFPAGRSHYLTFYGVKPFANIQLYDIDYSPDNQFESYDASGYLYKKEAGALYIKMKHKKDSEDIKLAF